MSEIDQLLSQVPLDQVAAELGVDRAEAEQAVRTALPALLGGLQANVADPAGARSLGQALGEHTGADYSAGLGSIDTADGQAIVDNIFGGSTNDVVAQLGGVGGSGGSGIMRKLLPILAPIVLSWLAGKLTERGGLGGVLGDLVGGAAGGAGGRRSGGEVGDVIGDILGGGRGSSGTGGGGLGDILGDVLGGGATGRPPAGQVTDGALEQPTGPLIPTDGGPAPDARGSTQADDNPLGGVLGDILGGVLGAGGGSGRQQSGGGGILDGLGGLLGGGKR